MKKYHLGILFILITFITSCGVSKKAALTHEKISLARRTISQDSLLLDSLESKMERQVANRSIDSSVANNIQTIIEKLQNDLKNIEETVNAADLIAQNKANLREKKYYHYANNYLSKIDSFHLKESYRERVYELLNEAVSVDAFRKYQMGAFFKPGAYKIPYSASKVVEEHFKPVIDSIINRSNKYADITCRVHIVLVGYADALSFSPNTPLYALLKSYTREENPEKGLLNLVLSNLRANELLYHIKMLVKENATRFNSYNNLNIGYVAYGRGEALPFPNITDYQVDDERRRVVVFYWSVLPDLG